MIKKHIGNCVYRRKRRYSPCYAAIAPRHHRGQRSEVKDLHPSLQLTTPPSDCFYFILRDFG